jgi:DNA-binding transcriptional MerR regulator
MSDMNLSTGQLSGITRVSYMALYRYVRDYSEFFSDTAKQHKRGRRWTMADLEVVQAIRYLQHERTPKAEIHRLLSSGWRPPANSAFNMETLTRLIEVTLASAEQSTKMVNDVQKAVEGIKHYKSVVTENSMELVEIKKEIMNLNRHVRNIYTLIDNIKKQRNIFKF